MKKPRAEGITAGIAVKTKPAKRDAAGIAPSFDTIGTFPVGNGAEGLTFDGTNIWCANLLDDSVIKLRASDGVIEGTFPVGGQPRQREESLTQTPTAWKAKDFAYGSNLHALADQCLRVRASTC